MPITQRNAAEFERIKIAYQEARTKGEAAGEFYAPKDESYIYLLKALGVKNPNEEDLGNIMKLANSVPTSHKNKSRVPLKYHIRFYLHKLGLMKL